MKSPLTFVEHHRANYGPKRSLYQVDAVWNGVVVAVITVGMFSGSHRLWAANFIITGSETVKTSRRFTSYASLADMKKALRARARAALEARPAATEPLFVQVVGSQDAVNIGPFDSRAAAEKFQTDVSPSFTANIMTQAEIDESNTKYGAIPLQSPDTFFEGGA